MYTGSNVTENSNETTICKIVENGDFESKYKVWFLVPAFVITLTLALLEKRRGVKPDLFGGRPALISPFRFLDDSGNRYGILLAFGSIIVTIFEAAFQSFKVSELPVWAKIFNLYLQCIIASFMCYPLFVCMTTRHKLAGSITGLLYASGWFTFETYRTVQGWICSYQFGQANAGIIFIGLPTTICNFLLIPKFCVMLYKCCRQGVYNSPSEVVLSKNHHITYVRHLLGKPFKNTERLSIKEKIMFKWLHQVPGFRFPISIMITTFLSAIILYEVNAYFAYIFDLLAKYTFHKYLPEYMLYLDLIQVSIAVATIMTFVLGLRNMYVFLYIYRRDMLSLYKGDRSFIPKSLQSPSPALYMSHGVKYIGTSIAGMLWGSIILYPLILLPLASTMMVIRYLDKNDKLHNIWEQFQVLVYPVSMIVIFKIQTFIVGHFFIQPRLNPTDKHRPLAVDNRNVYDIFSFFMVFVNASLGIFAFLQRILIGAFLGVFLIPRLDKCLLIKGYETMDKGYSSYIGMLMVEEAHNHPVMRVFVSLVKQMTENRRDKQPLNSTVDNPVYGCIEFPPRRRTGIAPSRAKRRWWLLYSLIRNPSLVALRVQTEYTLASYSGVDVNDIEYSTASEAEQNGTEVESWKCSFRCCNHKKCTIPSSVVINLMAAIVVICGLFLYAGIKAAIPKT